MMSAVRSELVKFFTTRLWWGMAIGVAVSAAGFAVLFAVMFTSDEVAQAAMAGGAPTGDRTQVVNSVYAAGLSVGYLLMLTIGVMQIGAEYRHMTITSTFLATPRRLRVMAAKVLALLLIGAMYGVLSVVSSVAFGALTLSLNDVDPFPSGEVFRTMALCLLALGLWALIGLGIGILIPNQVAALLIGVGVAWLAEPLLGLALSFWDFAKEHIVPYLPSQATSAITAGVQQQGQVQISWWAGALTLACYAALLAGFGSWRAARQDVT